MRLLHVTPSNLHTKLPPTPASCQVTRKSVSDTQTLENRVCPAGRGCHLCSPGDGASPPLEETVSPQDTGAHGSVGPGREGRPWLTQPSTAVGPSTRLSRVCRPPSPSQGCCWRRGEQGAGDEAALGGGLRHFPPATEGVTHRGWSPWPAAVTSQSHSGVSPWLAGGRPTWRPHHDSGQPSA